MTGPGAHPWRHRISVSGSSSHRQTVAQDLALWARHDVGCVSVPFGKLRPGDAELVAAAGLRVASVLVLGTRVDRPQEWPAYRDRVARLFDAARTMGAEHVALTTGSAGPMPWDEAAGAFAELISPLAAAAPVPVLLEHTNQLRSDISFVFRLRDAVDLARPLGMGVLMETTACWQERGLADTITDAADAIGLVHVSDLGPLVVSTPDRLVPGDGVIPLARLARTLLAAGYTGPFELEYAGPRIEAMGYDAALARAVPALTAILESAAASLA